MLVLVVVAAAIAVGAGRTIASSAVTVNGVALSQRQFNLELDAIAASAPFQCYLRAQSALNSVGPTSITGTSTRSWSTALAVGWVTARTRDLALVAYVRAHDLKALSPASLAAAQANLDHLITSTIAQALNSVSGFSCPAARSGAVTLASMPGWFRANQVEAQAAELALPSLVAPRIPTRGPALRSWFNQHATEYETTCLSYIVTPDAETAQAAASAVTAGLPFAEAAKQYSTDASAARGGSIGCISPSSSSWAGVRIYVGSVPTGKLSEVFPAPSGQGYWLFEVTKRTPNSFERIHTAVQRDAVARNLERPTQLAWTIQRYAGVAVNPALGTWLPNALGGTIVPPPMPPPASVTNPAANAPAAP